MNDYFSNSLTPIGKMFETKKEEAETKFNGTAHIKIEFEGEANDASMEQHSDKNILDENGLERDEN